VQTCVIDAGSEFHSRAAGIASVGSVPAQHHFTGQPVGSRPVVSGVVLQDRGPFFDQFQHGIDDLRRLQRRGHRAGVGRAGRQDRRGHDLHSVGGRLWWHGFDHDGRLQGRQDRWGSSPDRRGLNQVGWGRGRRPWQRPPAAFRLGKQPGRQALTQPLFDGTAADSLGLIGGPGGGHDGLHDVPGGHGSVSVLFPIRVPYSGKYGTRVRCQ
jgi:hypothetical protein